MLRLKDEVLDKALLRRTKTTRADDIILPPRIVSVRRDRLDPREDDFYQALYTQSQASFNTYVQAGTVLNNYAHIFDILIRLRQAADHPYLVLHSETSQYGTSSTAAAAAPTITCTLCKEVLEDVLAVEWCASRRPLTENS